MSNDTSGITDWIHPTSQIPQRGLEEARAATGQELAQLAAELEILAVEQLTARYRLTPLTAGRFRLSGTVSARVVQACVVTLDPVATLIEEPLDVEFHPPGHVPEEDTGTAEAELPAVAAAEHEIIEHNRLAVGRIVKETVAAALPPYPRAPDAALDHTEAGPAEPGAASPFAALADWKPKAR